MDPRTILAEIDDTRRENARIGIMDGNLRVEDLEVGADYLTGWVASRSKKGEWKGYQVTLNSQERFCECPDWHYRGPGRHASNNQITVCKHMAVLSSWSIAQEIKQAA